jgi:hypothetical protein
LQHAGAREREVTTEEQAQEGIRARQREVGTGNGTDDASG